MKINPIYSPWDGAQIGEVPVHSAVDVDQAVLDATDARSRSPLPAWQRAEILTRASELVSRRNEQLAITITRESAKPISAARTEVERTSTTLLFSAAEARRLAGEVIPLEGSSVGEGRIAYTIRVSVGVVGAIGPFNYPLNLVAHKVGPAIAAGCSVVLKPATQTPFSGLALAAILSECGLPDGWLRVVTGDGSSVGAAIVRHPGIGYITFTGSAQVGWNMQKEAPRKRIGLELGNSTPVIVEPDADWQEAARSICVGGYSTSGQSCISVQRVYVHRAIAAEFTEYLRTLVKEVPTGDPMDDKTVVSALIAKKEVNRVVDWCDEAVRQGAQLLCGGDREGPLVNPTLLSGTRLDMRVQSEEVFGPVVSLQEYDHLDEALALANGTRYGLQAGIFTNDIRNGLRATRELEFGGVLVNEIPTWRSDLMPYGGVKDSGNTREGPAYAIQAMTEPRLAVIKH